MRSKEELDAAWDKATGLHRAGRLAEAETIYRQILASQPRMPQVWHQLAIAAWQQGRHAEAVASFDRALAANPDLIEALFARSDLLMKMDRFAEAMTSLDRLVALAPDNPEAWILRSGALLFQRRLVEALEALDRALALNPDHADALTNRAGILQQLGRNGEALESLDKAMTTRPGDARVLNLRGATLAMLGRLQEGLADVEAALAISPQMVNAHYNHAGVLAELQRFEDAVAAYDRVLALAPNFTIAHGKRGAALKMLGQPEEALAAWRRAPQDFDALTNIAQLLHDMQRFAEALEVYNAALALQPHPIVMANRAGLLANMRRMDEARAGYDAAVRLDPNQPQVLNNRAMLLWQHFMDFDAAIADLEALLKLDPDYEYAQGLLLHLQMQAADWRDYHASLARIEAGVRQGKRVARPFVLQALSSSPAELQSCAQVCAERFYPAQPAVWRPREHGKDGRIRLGYLCGEFRDQATAILAAGLFERHDKNRFELFAFDNGWSDQSPMRARLENAFEHFVPIAGLNDAAAAESVARAGVDILVSLNGYFGQARMSVFTRRPAPIQVNYLGFPGTLGAPYIDYIIADRIVIPAKEKRFYTEQVVWLPDSYQVNDDQRAIGAPASRAAHGLPEDAFVFCNFNQTYKLTPEMFDSWMRILSARPGSVLWLLGQRPALVENLRREAEARGVAGSRLIFAAAMGHADHLARLGLADLALDTLPCNAHTGASDALWAGLPLLTCRGTAFAGRVAASLLSAVGLPELIAENLAEFEARAIALAKGKKELAGLRTRLAENRSRMPLFDTDRYRRHIEAAYETMWEKFAKGETPTAFAVGAKT